MFWCYMNFDKIKTCQTLLILDEFSSCTTGKSYLVLSETSQNFFVIAYTFDIQEMWLVASAWHRKTFDN